MATITDNQRLVSATTRHGYPIPCYDDSRGPLWIHRDSMGISGIVRAQTWEDAYSICEDEFFPEADKTIEELIQEYGFWREHVKIIKPFGEPEREARLSDYPHVVRPAPDGRANWEFVRWGTRDTLDPDAWPDNGLFQEAYGLRPNGPNAKDKLRHGIYAKDLNGDRLDLLTDDLIAELGLTINISDFYELEVTSNGRNWWPFNGESKEEAMAAFEEWKAKGHGVTLERNGELVAYSPEQTETPASKAHDNTP